jgi:hypothetical protein
MVYFPDNSTADSTAPGGGTPVETQPVHNFDPEPATGEIEATDADEKDGGDGKDDGAEQDAEPSLLDRVSTVARKVADTLDPFTGILTAIVQLFTVRRLVG